MRIVSRLKLAVPTLWTCQITRQNTWIKIVHAAWSTSLKISYSIFYELVVFRSSRSRTCPKIGPTDNGKCALMSAVPTKVCSAGRGCIRTSLSLMYGKMGWAIRLETDCHHVNFCRYKDSSQIKAKIRYVPLLYMSQGSHA